MTSVDNISKLNESYEINPSLSYKVQFKDNKSTSGKMSRPQIIKMVDTKRVCSVAPRQCEANVSKPATQTDAEDEVVNRDVPSSTTPTLNSQIMTPEGQNEFQEKVDSVRCYWSKLIETREQQRGTDEVDKSTTTTSKVDDKEIENRNFVTSLAKAEPPQISSEKKPKIAGVDEVTSYSPHVEIIELNGEKQTAVVNSHNFEVQDFDHVRYKVMKSDTFQKNILTHSRKEAQFDGLLQYLQDYSFQVRNMSISIYTFPYKLFTHFFRNFWPITMW